MYRQGLALLKWLKIREAKAITQILPQTLVTAYLDDFVSIIVFYLRRLRIHSYVLTGRLRAITQVLLQTLVTREIGFENCCRRKD